MSNSNRPGPGAAFLASLPTRFRPDHETIVRLARKVDVLLGAGIERAELARQLTAGADSEHSPGAAVIRRIERFPLPKGVQPPEKPPWCGKCEERTRQLENAEGLPYRCPRCHPLAVGA